MALPLARTRIRSTTGSWGLAQLRWRGGSGDGPLGTTRSRHRGVQDACICIPARVSSVDPLEGLLRTGMIGSLQSIVIYDGAGGISLMCAGYRAIDNRCNEVNEDPGARCGLVLAAAP